MTSLDDSGIISDSLGILLWDIDGTLVKKSGEPHFSRHLCALGLNQSSNENYELTGLSDWDVLVELGRVHEIDKEALENAFERLNSVQDSADNQTYRKLSGVEEILLNASRNGWRNGILSGNTYFSAIRKLQDSGLLSYFDPEILFVCQANESRADIGQRAKKELGYKTQPVVVVGDTEHDIAVARKCGFFVISVSTGIRNRNYLQTFKPNLILDNLNLKPEIFMSLLGSLVQNIETKNGKCVGPNNDR